MRKLTDIDTNFKVETKLDIAGIKFCDIQAAPFKIYGVFKADGIYRRMPEAVAKSVSNGVYDLHTHGAGGRVRFKTDSPYVAINAVFASVGKMPHFALTGSAGFDIYVSYNGEPETYCGSFVPPFDIEKCYESVVHFEDKKMRQITVNFPTYSAVKDLYIGLDENSQIEESDEYAIQKPIVYYGSSITQGGCVSRPGNTYQARISRRLNADHINLGFSGSAMAENEIIEYIKKLPMSVFVYDYDHNAPGIEHLNNTHEKMFKAIRESNPELPIVMMSAPLYNPNSYWAQRLEIVKKTYDNAVASGDKNVYFIDGKTLMRLAGNDGTVDNCHPNDLGFYSMAEAVGEVLEKILK